MKIGLMALSGIRAENPTLNELGMTLPGFVERKKIVASMPSLSLLTLAGLTPEGHEMRYFEIPGAVDEVNIPEDLDLAAISSFSARIKDAYRLSEKLRKRGIRTVIGGLHASRMPEEAAQHCDAVVVGEGEPVWAGMISDAAHGILKPRYGALNSSFDLTKAPMPAYGLLDVETYNRLPVQTSRGCPFVCEFCASSILLTNRYKQKPVEKVILEIRRIKEFWKEPFIEFADDNSFVNKPYWKELIPKLAQEKVQWFTETDVSLADDMELLAMMAGSGCRQVLIGLESPNAVGLEGLEIKTNWKRRRFDGYVEAVRKIQSAGITVNGCFILGMDAHGPDIFDAVHRFVRESELYEVQITLWTPFPGTPLYQRLRREGRLLHEDAWEKCTLFDVNFRPAKMTVRELEQGFIGLAEKLYNQDFRNWRRENFKAKYALRN
jgi:radical SAM superfamily enzyme YgiQ (UPF0313 family)